MAEGAEAESTINMKPATDCVWDISLFQNTGYAANLACIVCGHPPKKCFMDKSQQTFCQKCSEPYLQKGEKIDPNLFADGLIAKAEIVCKNTLFPAPAASEEKKEEPKQCEWKGLVKDWANHNEKECEFTVVNCDDCDAYSSSRSLQAEHCKVCGFATIQCPLDCKGTILRKDTEKHTKDECPKTILECKNDGCDEKIIRELFNDHFTQECPKRIVECPYSQYGCTQSNVKYEEMETHMQQFEIKHLQFQLNSLFQLMSQQQTMDFGSGMIRMFGGSMIPKGWIVCDGQHGTPDLTDKFLLKTKRKKKLLRDIVNDVQTVDEFEISEIDEDEQENTCDDFSPQYSMIYIMKI